MTIPILPMTVGNILLNKHSTIPPSIHIEGMSSCPSSHLVDARLLAKFVQKRTSSQMRISHLSIIAMLSS